VTGSRTLAFGHKRYGRLSLSTLGLLVFFSWTGLVVEFRAGAIADDNDNDNNVDIFDDEDFVAVKSAALSRRKHVNGIELQVYELTQVIGPVACCRINNRALRRILDDSDEVCRPPYRRIIIHRFYSAQFISSCI